MNKLIKDGLYGIALLGIVATVIVAHTPAVMAQGGQDRVVAIVNGKELRQYHFMNVMNRILPLAPSHGGLTPEVISKNTDKAIRELVEDELLYQEAERQGLKPDRKQLKNDLNALKSRVGSKKDMKDFLQAVGLSREGLERMAAKPQLVRKLIELEVNQKAVVSEAEAREYYEKNKGTHFMIEKRRMRLIYFRTDPGAPESWESAYKKAVEVLELIKGGADFAEMARKHSEGPRRESGGDTGLLDRTQVPDSYKPVRDAAWSMEKGEVSEVVQTIFGFYLVKVVETPEPGAYPFETINEQVVLTLKMIKKQALRARLMDRLKAKADIKVLVGEYK